MDAKALLDELMGRDRDLPLHEKKRKPRYDDDNVCRYFLAAFCPHDLFPNTKSDLGPCPKIHDESLKEEFKMSNKVAAFEGDLLAYLERLIGDLERKIRKHHERIDKELPTLEASRANTERIASIAAEAEKLVREAEKLGEDGQVDQAQAVMLKVELLNREKDALLRAGVPEYSSLIEKEKRMQVCDVCGAMQASTDTEKRLTSHIEGKQHMGYALIRETANKLQKKREEEAKKREAEREARRLDSGNGKEPAADKKAQEPVKGTDRDASRDKDKDRSYNRSRSDREKDRGQEKERDRDRDKERERDGERDRERDRRDRDHRRDRDRDRGRERRQRSRSRSRERRR